MAAYGTSATCLLSIGTSCDGAKADSVDHANLTAFVAAADERGFCGHRITYSAMIEGASFSEWPFLGLLKTDIGASQEPPSVEREQASDIGSDPIRQPRFVLLLVGLTIEHGAIG